MARPPPSYSQDVINWYRNALNRDPDLEGLAFWTKMYEQGAEVTWNAFTYVSSSLGYPITMTREEASKPAEVGNNFTVVDEWIKNLNVAARPDKYMLMMSNGVPIPEVFKQFCADFNIKGFDWLEASKLR